jgi:hypothetical protein
MMSINAKGIFVGIARNVRRYVGSVLANMEEYSEGFSDKQIIVLENDSVDGTQDALRGWAEVSDAHTYIRVDDAPSRDLSRTERLGYFRNIYLTEIEKEKYTHFDYVVVFDCDSVNSGSIDKEAFLDAIRFLRSDKQHAAVFANSKGFYYDVWPLRHPTWCPGDCFQDLDRMRGVTSESEAALSCLGARQVRIDPMTAPIQVGSAFGGLGIYKKSFIFGKRYSGLCHDGTYLCEHVPLNESIVNDGGKLFIFPSLLVSTQYEHIFRPRDRIYYVTRVGEYLKEWKLHWEALISSRRTVAADRFKGPNANLY